MLSMSCTSKVRCIALSVITVCDPNNTLSLKVPNVEFDVSALIRQNLTTTLKYEALSYRANEYSTLGRALMSKS